MRTPHGSRSLFVLGGAAAAIFAVAGCTVVSSDPLLDDGGTPDTSDSAVADAETSTTETSATDTATATAVIVRATDLYGGTESDVRDFGGGSTRLDLEGGRIAYAIARAGTIESGEFGRDAGGALLDGRIVGLTPGVKATITVTGYLRGRNGVGADPADRRIAWAETTCEATPSATADVVATCAKKLALLPTLKGIVFTSDILPDGYCAGKGKTNFEQFEAKTPYTGSAVASRYVTDCEGVIYIPWEQFSSIESTDLTTTWMLSVGVKGMSTACTMNPPGCTVRRKNSMGEELDVAVVGKNLDGVTDCKLTTANTSPNTCF